ncbi:MAG: hypothetical protein J6I97_00105 [Agathobacter sp.]|nr:hypothetical protein [Agathobacter sp.]
MHLDIIFKAFVATLVVVVMIGSGLGVTMGFAEYVEAENYMQSVSKVILESNYNEAVIEQCQKEAANNGYVLEVTVEEAKKAGVKRFAQLKFTYDFTIELFQIRQQKMKVKII